MKTVNIVFKGKIKIFVMDNIKYCDDCFFFISEQSEVKQSTLLPRFDPSAPGALVMPRPDTSHQVSFCVCVCVVRERGNSSCIVTDMICVKRK